MNASQACKDMLRPFAPPLLCKLGIGSSQSLCRASTNGKAEEQQGRVDASNKGEIMGSFSTGTSPAFELNTRNRTEGAAGAKLALTQGVQGLDKPEYGNLTSLAPKLPRRSPQGGAEGAVGVYGTRRLLCATYTSPCVGFRGHMTWGRQACRGTDPALSIFPPRSVEIPCRDLSPHRELHGGLQKGRSLARNPLALPPGFKWRTFEANGEHGSVTNRGSGIK